MASNVEQAAAKVTLVSMGATPSDVTNILLTDTTAITTTKDDVVRAIQVLSDCAFTTLTGNVTKNGIATAAVGADYGTLTAGTIIYGEFSAVTLASGSVILYR